MVALFLGILGFLGYRIAAQRGLATLIEESGSVERDFARAVADWQSAEEGDSFDSGDGARTDNGDRAVFRLFTGAKLTLQPASRVRFARGDQERSLGIHVEVGEAEIATKDGGMTIDSEFGPIVLEQNSSVSVSRKGGRLAVAVELGSVVLGIEERRVEAGETLSIELGGIVLEEESSAPATAPADVEDEADEAPPLDPGDGVARADLVAGPGQSFTVHDPSPPTAVGIEVSRACDGKPGRLVVGRRFAEATDRAALVLSPGRHDYEVRCLETPEVVAASGRIVILRDAGTKALPSFAPSANVTTDGRRYTVLYQHRLPQVTVSWPNAPQAEQFTLTVDGRAITTTRPSYTFSSLQGGTHQLAFSANSEPPRRSRTTTIVVAYDSQAPTARVAMSPEGYDPTRRVEVAGQALPGWTVSVNGNELEVDGQRRFSTQVEAEDSLPITFSHPTHGTHYYLRRSQTSAP